jgi:hypothetical protein
MAGNRWTGLALVGLLALIAQPAALVATPAPHTSVGEDPARECSTLDSLDDPELVETVLAAEADVDQASDVCLEDVSTVTDETPGTALVDADPDALG